MASQTLLMGTESVQISAERLQQAEFIDDTAKAYLYPTVLTESGLKLPEPGKVLYSGIVFKEGHVNTKFESRLLKLRIEKDWTPMLTYAKPEAPQEVLAEYHLQSFTFVPTKLARKEFVMTWRLDSTGVSVGKSKHDKLVVAFKNVQECHLWQAAFSLCRAPQKIAEDLKRKYLDEESALAEAAKEEQQRLEQEQEAERTAALELAIAQNIEKVAAEKLLLEAQALAAAAAAEAEVARLAMEKEQREADEARAIMEKEQAEAEEAKRVLEKEAAEAEAARLLMLKEEHEAEEARKAMMKETLEAEEAKAKFDKEQAEFLVAAAEHAKEFEEAEIAFKRLEDVRAALSVALQKGDPQEIASLQAAVASAQAAWEKEAEEAKDALDRMKKEQQEAEEARALHQKEQEEADAAVQNYSKEEAEAEAARIAHQKEESERIEALKAYEKEKSEADSATADYEREAAEAEEAKAMHGQKQREADEAKALQQQREKELAATKATGTELQKKEGEAEERRKAQAAPKPKVDPEQVKAALAFVTGGGTLNKYMRDKLVNAKWHEPRPKTVKMNGTQIVWDKRSFQVVNAKLGGSMLLRANNTGDNLDCNFYCSLSGVPGGQDALDFQAPSKEIAEKWVLGILASIGNL